MWRRGAGREDPAMDCVDGDWGEEAENERRLGWMGDDSDVRLEKRTMLRIEKKKLPWLFYLFFLHKVTRSSPLWKAQI